jgi:tetratricopeptide (TPR) repeat protein
VTDSFYKIVIVLAASGNILCSAAAASNVAADFESANRFYEQGKFEEAESAYEKIVQAGFISDALYFNLGNARFKSGEIGRAIAAYRQAEQLAPRDPDIRANLQFIRNQIQGPTLSADRWQQWLKKLTVNEWSMLASAALWLCLLLMAATQIRPALKPALRPFLVAGAFAFLGLGICAGASLSLDSAKIAIVTTRDATVRNGPLDESPGAFTVHDGAELPVLDQKDNWIQITIGNRIGWLKRDQVWLEK